MPIICIHLMSAVDNDENMPLAFTIVFKFALKYELSVRINVGKVIDYFNIQLFDTITMALP